MSPQFSVSTQRAISRQKYGTALFAIGVALASGIGFNKLRGNHLQTPSKTALLNGMWGPDSEDTSTDDAKSIYNKTPSGVTSAEPKKEVKTLAAMFESDKSLSEPPKTRPKPPPRPAPRKKAAASPVEPSKNPRSSLPRKTIADIKKQIELDFSRRKQDSGDEAPTEKNKPIKSGSNQGFNYFSPISPTNLQDSSHTQVLDATQITVSIQETQDEQDSANKCQADSPLGMNPMPDDRNPVGLEKASFRRSTFQQDVSDPAGQTGVEPLTSESDGNYALDGDGISLDTARLNERQGDLTVGLDDQTDEHNSVVLGQNSSLHSSRQSNVSDPEAQTVVARPTREDDDRDARGEEGESFKIYPSDDESESGKQNETSELAGRPRTRTVNSRYVKAGSPIASICRTIRKNPKRAIAISVIAGILLIVLPILIAYFTGSNPDVLDPQATQMPVPFNETDLYNATGSSNATGSGNVTESVYVIDFD